MSEPEINCGNCAAACCVKGTEMVLSSADVDFMIRGGTKLKITDDRSKRVGLLAEFVLLDTCGWLEKGLCTAYDDPERPAVCEEFPAGSPGCAAVRLARGVAPPVFDTTGETAKLAVVALTA